MGSMGNRTIDKHFGEYIKILLENTTFKDIMEIFYSEYDVGNVLTVYNDLNAFDDNELKYYAQFHYNTENRYCFNNSRNYEIMMIYMSQKYFYNMKLLTIWYFDYVYDKTKELKPITKDEIMLKHFNILFTLYYKEHWLDKNITYNHANILFLQWFINYYKIKIPYKIFTLSDEVCRNNFPLFKLLIDESNYTKEEIIKYILPGCEFPHFCLKYNMKDETNEDDNFHDVFHKFSKNAYICCPLCENYFTYQSKYCDSLYDKKSITHDNFINYVYLIMKYDITIEDLDSNEIIAMCQYNCLCYCTDCCDNQYYWYNKNYAKKCNKFTKCEKYHKQLLANQFFKKSDSLLSKLYDNELIKLLKKNDKHNIFIYHLQKLYSNDEILC